MERIENLRITEDRRDMEVPEKYSKLEDQCDSDDEHVKTHLLHLFKKHLIGKCPLFPTSTTDKEILRVLKDLEAWEPPSYYLKNGHSPYWYTGRTEDGSPVWVAEYGKPDPREMLKEPETIAAIDRVIIQMMQISAKSWMVKTSSSSAQFRRLKVIVDLEGLQWAKISNVQLISLGATVGKRYISLGEDIVDEIIIINANGILDFLVKKFRWLLKRLMKKVEIYGQDSSEWIPVLQKKFPLHTLPLKYGGSLAREPLYAPQYISQYKTVVFAANINDRDVL